MEVAIVSVDAENLEEKFAAAEEMWNHEIKVRISANKFHFTNSSNSLNILEGTCDCRASNNALTLGRKTEESRD